MESKYNCWYISSYEVLAAREARWRGVFRLSKGAITGLRIT